jgi:hypothetical protein
VTYFYFRILENDLEAINKAGFTQLKVVVSGWKNDGTPRKRTGGQGDKETRGGGE